jgi:hypothetical protein
MFVEGIVGTEVGREDYARAGPGVTRGISCPPDPEGAGDQAHGRDRMVPLSYGDPLGAGGKFFVGL